MSLGVVWRLLGTFMKITAVALSKEHFFIKINSKQYFCATADIQFTKSCNFLQHYRCLFYNVLHSCWVPNRKSWPDYRATGNCISKINNGFETHQHLNSSLQQSSISVNMKHTCGLNITAVGTLESNVREHGDTYTAM